MTEPVADLRRAPAREALAALCAALLPGGRVGRVRRLRGGIASGMHAVELIGPDGARLRVVVRRYGAERLALEPGACRREWEVLRLLERAGAPTPRPLWLDADGDVFGAPSLAISCLPGSGLLAPRDPDDYLGQLAEALGAIHGAPLDCAALAVLPDQQAELDGVLSRDRARAALDANPDGEAIRAAYGRLLSRVESRPERLLHGDYWAGNTLWRRGRLTGVVDWEQPRRGAPGRDVGYCRLDLTLLFGLEAAETFRRAYEAASGGPVAHLAFWDLFAIVWSIGQYEEWLPGYHDLGRVDVTVEVARSRMRGFIGQALASR